MRRFAWLAIFVGCSSPATLNTDLEIKAGTAKAKISPEEPVMLAGYPSPNRISQGVSRDLWARALALEDARGDRVVFVTADIIGFGPGMSRRIKAAAKERHGLDEGRLMLVGSHTHSGPVISERALVDRPEQARAKDAYIDRLCTTAGELIGDALKNLRPAKLSFSRGEARFGMNRRVKQPDGRWWFGDNPQGPTDPDVPVLVSRTLEGQVGAVVFTYACHCTSIRSNNEGFQQVHPDYAGVAAQELEHRFPGAAALYVTGCGGDIDPSPRGPLQRAEEHGRTLAEVVAAEVGRPDRRGVAGRLRARYRRVDLPLEKPDLERLQKLAADKGNQQKFAQETLRKIEQGSAATSVNYPLQVWELGPELTLVALGGEVCVDYALRLKGELGRDKHWVVGYANEVMCYIPSERVLAESGYESGWALSQGKGVASYQMSGSGWPTPFAAGLEDRLIKTVREMVTP